MWFASLGAFIEGLTEQSPYVNWGVTSATCFEPNSHEIEFVSLFNGNLSKQINLLHKGSVLEETWLFSDISYDFNTCGKPLDIRFPATVIVNKKPICLIGDNILDFLDIDIRGAKFFVKNKNIDTNNGWERQEHQDSINKHIGGTNEIIRVVNTKFNFTQYLTDTNYLLGRGSNENNYILLKVVLANGQGTLHFKINFWERVLAKHFIGLSDSLSMEIMSNNSHITNGKMIVTNDSTYSISLPKKTDCSFRIKYNEADSSKFSVIPTIDSVTSQLVFAIKTDVCRTTLTLLWDCDDDCPPEHLTLQLKGADCDCASLPDSLENAEIKRAHIFEHYSNEYDFTFKAPPGFTIDTIVNLTILHNYEEHLQEKKVGSQPTKTGS